MAEDLEGYMLVAQSRWDEAVVALERTVDRGGTTWLAEAAVCYIGDIHLSTGHPDAALTWYGRGLRAQRDLAALGDMAFQAEGIVAALADLGRHEDALEALGAADTLTAGGFHPRETVTHWGEVMAPRLDASRAALGPEAAEAASARGGSRSMDTAMKWLLSLTETTVVAT